MLGQKHKIVLLTLAHSFVGVAQLVEHITHKDKVTSSILVVDTKRKKPEEGFFEFIESTFLVRALRTYS